MSARVYALYSVCPQLSFLPSAVPYEHDGPDSIVRLFGKGWTTMVVSLALFYGVCTQLGLYLPLACIDHCIW